MNISKQLKNYRKELNISQEELSEIIHVSRQTISNWENGKSYPDLQSLVLLSDYFKISLDELVKGDVIMMKNELERKRLTKLSYWMLISFILICIGVAVVQKLDYNGLLFGLIAMIPYFYLMFKIGSIKKDKNIKTYSEILDYIEGREPQKMDENTRNKKVIKESIISALCGAVFGFSVMYFL